MDKLEHIFSLQRGFNEKLREDRNLNFPMEQWIQKETLAMISELSEVLDEVNFKWWKNERPVVPEKLKGELVDVLHFFIAMCLDAGMTAEELHGMYVEKNRINFERQKGVWGKDYRADVE